MSTTEEKQAFISSNTIPACQEAWVCQEVVSPKHGSGITYLSVWVDCTIKIPHVEAGNNKEAQRRRWVLATVKAELRVGRREMEKGNAMLSGRSDGLSIDRWNILVPYTIGMVFRRYTKNLCYWDDVLNEQKLLQLFRQILSRCYTRVDYLHCCLVICGPCLADGSGLMVRWRRQSLGLSVKPRLAGEKTIWGEFKK